MTLLPRTRGPIYHVPHGTPYHEENSVRGVDKGASLGFPRIDIDISMDADGNLRANHWGPLMLLDGFRDPVRPTRSKKTPIYKLSELEVDRLVAPGGYKCQHLEVILQRCKTKHIVPVLEPKCVTPDPRMAAQATWDHIAALGKQIGVELQARALKQNAAALPKARKAGIPAWRI